MSTINSTENLDATRNAYQAYKNLSQKSVKVRQKHYNGDELHANHDHTYSYNQYKVPKIKKISSKIHVNYNAPHIEGSTEVPAETRAAKLKFSAQKYSEYSAYDNQPYSTEVPAETRAESLKYMLKQTHTTLNYDFNAPHLEGTTEVPAETRSAFKAYMESSQDHVLSDSSSTHDLSYFSAEPATLATPSAVDVSGVYIADNYDLSAGYSLFNTQQFNALIY